MTWVPLCLGAFSALVGAAPAELEDLAARQVALQFERVGRRTPVRDEVLAAAARRLAQVALEHNARAAAELVTLTEAISAGGGWDVSPRILVIRGTPPEEPLKSLSARKDLASEAASHLGVGMAVKPGAAAVVLLFAVRKMELSPFARAYLRPTSPKELCGSLHPPLGQPELFVTLPDGKVNRLLPSPVVEGRVCAKIPLRTRGRYTVEVLGRGPRGPEVAALFFVDVGPAPGRAEPLGEEPADPLLASALLLERINALRAAHRLPPLELCPDASLVAGAYSAQMAKERFFAHVSPDGSTVGQRLREAGYPFRSAGENLGMASGPLSAHFGLEHSPGHRKNLLEPQWKKVGIGLAQQQMGDGTELTLLTQIFVEPLAGSGDPLDFAYRVLDQRRAALSLPALVRSPVLEQLAKDHARRALEADAPSADLDGSRLHQRVFTAMGEVAAASVDLFVADSPTLVEAGKAAAKPESHWVGIGAVKGDSARHGRGKYWVVVIYASRR